MHPSQIIDETAQLIALLLRFEHPADAVVSHYFREHKSLGPRERATIAEAAYAMLRLKPRYEHYANSYGMGGQGAQMKRFALLALSDATSLPLELATNAAERAWLAHCKAQDIGMHAAPQRHCLPTWLANALHDQYGAATEGIAMSLLQSAPLDLRVNVLKAKREGADSAMSKLSIADIKCDISRYSPWGIRLESKPNVSRLEAFVKGEIEVQDEGSQLLAHLTGAKRGEMVADFCAGAGGKTLALGAMMRNTGRLYAFDVSAKRLDKLKPRLARSGLSNVHPVAIEHERDARIKRLAAKMDRVLVDAPCSGLGTLRRNPDLKWRQTPQSVKELQAKQSSILQSAASLVKPGGRLIYATCSLLTAENQDIAQAFLDANPEFLSVDMGQWAESLGLEMAANSQNSLHFVVLRPDLHETDGFFAAVFERTL